MRTAEKKRRQLFHHDEHRTNMKWISILMTTFIVAVLLIGCSSSESSDSALSVADYNESSANYSTSNTALSDSAVSANSTDADTLAEQGTSSDPSLGSAAISQVPTNQHQKLIYDADLVMEVKQYEVAKQRISDIIHLAGGYALQFTDQFTDYERGGQFTFKVPSKGFQSVLDQLNQVENVRFERNYSAEDVTEEYVDLTSRLKARRVNEARLLEYMEKATSTQDLLSLSQQLTSEQEVIEQITGRMRYIDNHVAMSTIDLRLYETIKSSPTSRLSGTFGERVGNALSGSLNSLKFIIEMLVIMFVALAPYLLVISLFAVPTVWFIRRYRKKHSHYPYNRHAERNSDLLQRQSLTSDKVTAIDKDQEGIQENSEENNKNDYR